MNNKINLWKINKFLDKELKQWQNLIITRFPPEPSGYLHIGHAKALFINYVLAKRYNGKIILRFDDTNPVNETDEYEQAIYQDTLDLGVNFDLITHTSDYFDKLIEYADLLIINGQAYVDSGLPEDIKKGRETTEDSPYRGSSIEVNKNLWEGMKRGEITNSILRIKIDMKHKINCMRDPTIFRYVQASHLRTGDKYKVYPTYDFACPIVDSIEGVTHVYRSAEFSDRDEQYNFILDILSLRKPLLDSYGRVNIQGTVMSKRKIKKLIQEGKLEGWDDPRLLTVRGARKRGLILDALIEYISRLGLSKTTTNMTPDMLWATNKKYIDKIATRFIGLDTNNISELRVLQEDSSYVEFLDEIQIMKFFRTPDLGMRSVYRTSSILLDNTDILSFADNEEITMMNWGNMYFNNLDHNLILHLSGDFKKTEKKVLWLPCKNTKFDKPNIPIIIKKYISNLNNDPDDIPEIKLLNLIGEPDMINVRKGEFVQLLRMEYYICDSEYDEKTNSPLVLIELPK